MNNMPSTSNVSVTQKLLSYLQTGRDITANQARAKFGITNVSARMSELRKAGYAIYLNEKTTSQGYTIKAYRLGTPTRRMVAIANFVDSNPEFYGKASWINDRASRFMRNATV
jgi:predicted transcriptional regulator